MRAPLKLNLRTFPRWMKSIVPVSEDPTVLWSLVEKSHALEVDLSKGISMLKFGETFKTTSMGRHGESNQLVLNFLSELDEPASILDLGASTGVTSLDLLNLLPDNLQEYYVTDLNTKVLVSREKEWVAFYDTNNEPILMANKYCVLYNDDDIKYGLLKRFVDKKIKKLSRLKRNEIRLIEPKLEERMKKDDRIVFLHHDIFQSWTRSTPNVIKVSNILNRAYFSDELIKSAIQKITSSLKEKGLVFFSRNEGGTEKISAYTKQNNQLKHYQCLNGGVDIKDIIES